MNARRVAAAEGVILAAMQTRRTAAGIAVALESACLLQSPESTSELVALRAWVDSLETERHSTNEWVTDPAEALRVSRDRIAELEAAAAKVSALHAKFRDSNHCQYDGERWPCQTLQQIQRPGQMAEQRHLMDPLDHALEALAPHTPSTAGSAL
ncbi:hypothetical protein [Streptomyces sp. NBC_00233]|uniref:hypothetical protein n=1 Tax=Streptomyces sp. NBC_00233 TaxID=2975686 RepID=UPI00224CE092|nr:hypothetical protein [Streptomyces sp. NBC_00233]MCX5229726.1 hypothetical protein [Streptomyces sp. NBC_00233]